MFLLVHGPPVSLQQACSRALHKGPRRLRPPQGARCPEEFAAAATRFAQQLVKYESAEGTVVAVSQGREPAAFWECLTAVAGEAAAGSSSSSACSSAPGSPRENIAYDKDFEVSGLGWERAGTRRGADGRGLLGRPCGMACGEAAVAVHK